MIEVAKNLIAPDLCCVCGTRLLREECGVCSVCLSKFPLTGNHRNPDGPFTQQFLSTDIRFGRAAALFRYEPHTPVAKTIVAFKYHGRERLARHLGRHMAMRLIPVGFFAGVDCFVPVPIHFTRRMHRGYNQSEQIAAGIAEVSGIPVATWLNATHARATQTRLSAGEREKNAGKNRFRVRHSPDLAGRHVMLVDDVCTTGATIRACMRAINDYAPGVRISVLTLATAH